jgi:hypothetical protein
MADEYSAWLLASTNLGSGGASEDNIHTSYWINDLEGLAILKKLNVELTISSYARPPTTSSIHFNDISHQSLDWMMFWEEYRSMLRSQLLARIQFASSDG